MKKLTIVTCNESYHQALYVDEHLVESDSSLYANEVAEHAGDEPVLLASFGVDMPEDWHGSFPRDLSEVEPFYT